MKFMTAAGKISMGIERTFRSIAFLILSIERGLAMKNLSLRCLQGKKTHRVIFTDSGG
jgi:hypothetical protein